jgi:membrane fusion protein (multidrug efflux system)
MARDSRRVDDASITTTAPPEVTAGASGAVDRRPAGQGWWQWRPRLVVFGLLLVLLGIGTPYGLRLWQYYQTHESTDDAYIVGNVIPISPQVHGTVVAVQVEENQPVQAGQVLAQLDRRDFEVRVKQAEAAVAVAMAGVQRAEIEVPMMQESTSSDAERTGATLRAAQIAVREAEHSTEEAGARLRTLEAAVAVAQAEVDMAQTRLHMAQREATRLQALLNDGVVAQQQFDSADTALRSAQAQVRASQQRLVQAHLEVERMRLDLQGRQQAVERARAHTAEAQAVWAGAQANRQHVDVKHAQVATARAQLQQAEAELELARLQLSYTTIRAPGSGVVAKKRLEVGQVVQVGRPVLAVVPLPQIWVEANFKETQLRHMRPGQPVTLRVDAYPDQVWTGTVESLSPGTGAVFSLLPPENATGNFVKIVQRVPVKIVLDAAASPQAILRPGMSVIATVTTR